MYKHYRIIFFVFTMIVFFAACRQASKENTPGLFLPDDLEATLWAESPMLYNPTNMDVDSKGRVWVTEAVNYRNFNNDSTRVLHHNKGDRIMILEDTDQDGKADSAKVFIEDRDLVSPVGIAVIGNKVIVSCSPNLIVYTDENGDDQPDKKEIILTGFGGKDHDHSLHSVTAGPDGNWYFNVGNAGPHMVTDKSGWHLRSGSIYTGGSPYNEVNAGNQKSDDGRVWVGGLAMRVNPDGTGLKVMGHNFRNSYEVVTDSYGNLWQNDNDDGVVTCRTTWLMEGGNAGFFSADGTRTWQGDQRPEQEIFAAHWHQDDPGVMPAGDRSGAGAPTGIVRYEGDALGAGYSGMLLSADAGRNTIFGYHPSRKLSGYDLGKRENFITSVKADNEGYVWNDSLQNSKRETWFRPSDVTVGTDGALYVADWYDPVVGGHQMQDSIGYGRIYRITPKNKVLKAPVLNLKEIDGQIAALKNPAVNVRWLGFDALKKQGAAAIEPVSKLLQDPNPFIQARAVWLLAQLGEQGKAVVKNLFSESNDVLRGVALRALKSDSATLTSLAEKLAADTSSFVRRELAIALRDYPLAAKKNTLQQLAKQYDGQDRWYLESLGAAMDADAPYWYNDLKLALAKDVIPAKWTSSMAGFAWRLHPANAVTDLLQRAGDSGLSAAEKMQMITALSFVQDKAAVQAMVKLSQAADTKTKDQAVYWLAYRQTNDWTNKYDWSKISLNTAYERTLATMKVKRLIVLDERMSNDERSWRIGEMAVDSIGGQMLIGLLAENKIPKNLWPVVKDAIFKNPDLSVRVQAGNYFANTGEKAIYSVASITKLPQDAHAGELVFESKCSTCHRMGEKGQQIGPELTTISKKFDKVALTDAIINPSAAIVFGYEPWLVNTADGESVFGFLLSENKDQLVLKDISGHKHVIAKSSISKREKQLKSLMPEPMAAGLTEKDIADVVAFLGSNK
jgi:putative membrane-bound dehydrogenase-like protein